MIYRTRLTWQTQCHVHIKLCDSTQYATNLTVKHILHSVQHLVWQTDTLRYCLVGKLTHTCPSILCLAFFRFVSNQANQPTARSRVLLQKLTVRRLVKKLTAFYGIWTFITVVTKACHLFLSSATLIQSMSSHPICLRCFSIVPHLCPSLPSGLLSSCLLIKILTVLLFSLILVTSPTHFILPFLVILITSGKM